MKPYTGSLQSMNNINMADNNNSLIKYSKVLIVEEYNMLRLVTES